MANNRSKTDRREPQKVRNGQKEYEMAQEKLSMLDLVSLEIPREKRGVQSLLVRVQGLQKRRTTPVLPLRPWLVVAMGRSLKGCRQTHKG